MNVTYVVADGVNEWNSAEFRAAIPARAMNATGGRHSAKLVNVSDWAQLGGAGEYACADSDVIVVQRGVMPETFGALRYWRERGKVVLADVDDGYLQIDPSHPAWAFWTKGIVQTSQGRLQMTMAAIEQMANGLKNTHGLVSPNRLILDDWKGVTGIPGAFVPNYLDRSIYNVKRTRSRKDDGTVWIGWGGSAGHFQSFTGSRVSEALARVLAKRPNFRFVMCGSDIRILDRVPSRAFQKMNFAWREHRRWPEMLVNMDVMLIPMFGDFDARRSWLKPLECSMLGVPWIASRTPAYESLTGRGVFVDNSADEWVSAIIDIADNGPTRGTMRYAREWAESQTVEKNVDAIVSAYESLANGAMVKGN